MMTTRLSWREPWPTPSSAPIFRACVIAFTSSTSTSTPSLRNCRRAAGELHREEHVRRLVDEIARDDRRRRRRYGSARMPCGPPPSSATASENFALQRPCRRPSSWSCSDRRHKRAGAGPMPAERLRRGFIAPAGHSATMVTSVADDGILPAVAPPSLRKSRSFISDALPTPITRRRLAVSFAGATISSVEPDFPLKLAPCRSPPDEIDRRAQTLAGRRTELQAVIGEHHQNAACRSGQRDETNSQGIGHFTGLQRGQGAGPGVGRDSHP